MCNVPNGSLPTCHNATQRLEQGSAIPIGARPPCAANAEQSVQGGTFSQTTRPPRPKQQQSNSATTIACN